MFPGDNRLIISRDMKPSFLNTECPARGTRKETKETGSDRNKGRNKIRNKMMREEGEAKREEKQESSNTKPLPPTPHSTPPPHSPTGIL